METLKLATNLGRPETVKSNATSTVNTKKAQARVSTRVRRSPIQEEKWTIQAVIAPSVDNSPTLELIFRKGRMGSVCM